MNVYNANCSKYDVINGLCTNHTFKTMVWQTLSSIFWRNYQTYSYKTQDNRIDVTKNKLSRSISCRSKVTHLCSALSELINLWPLIDHCNTFLVFFCWSYSPNCIRKILKLKLLFKCTTIENSTRNESLNTHTQN